MLEQKEIKVSASCVFFRKNAWYSRLNVIKRLCFLWGIDIEVTEKMGRLRSQFEVTIRGSDDKYVNRISKIIGKSDLHVDY